MSEIINTFSNLPQVVLRGIGVGLLVSVCAALLGVVLVLKRYSMIGDGLSHVAFGAMSLALVLNLAPLAFSVPLVIFAAFLLLRINRKSNIDGDSLTAVVSSTSLAIGIVAVSLSGGLGTGVSDYMFGSIVAISRSDVYICVPVLIVIIAVFVIAYNKIFALSFDEGFARVSGVQTEKYNMLIALLTSLTVVIGMRIMGTLLISGLIVFPALSAMRVFHSFRGVTLGAAFVSGVCFLLGVLLSIICDTPVGAGIVIVNAAIFVILSFVGKFVKV